MKTSINVTHGLAALALCVVVANTLGLGSAFAAELQSITSELDDPDYIAAKARLNGPDDAQDCAITRAQYATLRPGMTYTEAVKAIGCEGDEITSSEVAGIKTNMYMWKGAGRPGANANAMFQNGRLIVKAQAGLSR